MCAPFGATEYRLLHVILTKFHQILSDHVKFHLNLTGSLCVSLLTVRSYDTENEHDVCGW
ncbi:DUF1869 domain-containing protein [Salmonella enterica]|nr:DUF1869 domain-containing protein [Salmonella enterica]EKL8763716.1 DUF1869 domain-containing protein [Salmonella enterica]